MNHKEITSADPTMESPFSNSHIWHSWFHTTKSFLCWSKGNTDIIKKTVHLKGVHNLHDVHGCIIVASYCYRQQTQTQQRNQNEILQKCGTLCVWAFTCPFTSYCMLLDGFLNTIFVIDVSSLWTQCRNKQMALKRQTLICSHCI